MQILNRAWANTDAIDSINSFRTSQRIEFQGTACRGSRTIDFINLRGGIVGGPVIRFRSRESVYIVNILLS